MPSANLPHSGRASSKDQPSQYASLGGKAAASSIIAIGKYLIKITSESGRHSDVISRQMNYRAWRTYDMRRQTMRRDAERLRNALQRHSPPSSGRHGLEKVLNDWRKTMTSVCSRGVRFGGFAGVPSFAFRLTASRPE